ncbi:unnamed protein product [Rotaria socialis]|uniref:Uncharacterized protein n=1 Tax=Rotaria socialis TaxID=392032 RepID=A0A820UUN2_9BILA|nr:unnamed protein product [Rotaria socialis]
MYNSYSQYGLNAPLPKYSEVGPDGSILYQSDQVPTYASTTYLQPHGAVHRSQLDMTDVRTSDYYRTFDIPERFDRPSWWQGYTKVESHPFYRTTNQEYGAYKPEVHTMPSVYRFQPHSFTSIRSIGGNFRRNGFNTSTISLVPKEVPRGTLPISLGSPRQANPFIDAALVFYTEYSIDFISILKIHFDLVCHRIRPDQVVFLKLQDDHNAPCQIQLFLSYFRVEQFTRLRSLTLTLDVSDSGTQIFLNLDKLSSLESLSLMSYETNGFYFARRYDNDIDVTQQDNTILVKILIKRVRPASMSTQKTHWSTREVICLSLIQQLRSLNIQLTTVLFDIEDPRRLPNLYKLILLNESKSLVNEGIVPNSSLSMDTIELLLSKLPQLRHLVLTGPANGNIANGHCWEILAMNLISFDFKFIIEVDRIDLVLESFRSWSWIEHKRWYIAYKEHCLLTVPYYTGITVKLPLHPPIYSTAPDNTLFYEHINHLILSEMSEEDLHHFHHVKLLDFRSSIPLEILQMKIDLNRVDCLILHSSIEPSLAVLIPLVMPLLKVIGLYCNMKEFLENARHMYYH